jgi:hypothetical protein
MRITLSENEIVPFVSGKLSDKGISHIKLHDNNSIEVGVRKKIAFFDISAQVYLNVFAREAKPAFSVDRIEGLPWGFGSAAKFIMSVFNFFPDGISVDGGVYIVDVNSFIKNSNIRLNINGIGVSSGRITADFSVV